MLLSTGGIYLLKPLSHFMIFRSLSTILILAGNLCLCAILYILLLLSFGIWKLFTSARSSFIYNLSEVYYNVFEYHFANIETSNKGDYHGIHIQ